MAFPKKISELPISPSLSNADLLAIVSGGITSQTTLGKIASAISGSVDTNTFVTGGTLTGADLTLQRNDGSLTNSINLGSLSGTPTLQNVLESGSVGSVATSVEIQTTGVGPPGRIQLLANNDLRLRSYKGEIDIESVLSGVTIVANNDVDIESVLSGVTIVANNNVDINAGEDLRLDGQQVVSIRSSLHNVGIVSVSGDIDVDAGRDIILTAARNVTVGDLVSGTSIPSTGDFLASIDGFGNVEWATPPTFTGNTETTPINELWLAGDIHLDNSQSIMVKTNPAGVTSGVLSMNSDNTTFIKGNGGGFKILDSGGIPQFSMDNGIGINSNATFEGNVIINGDLDLCSGGTLYVSSISGCSPVVIGGGVEITGGLAVDGALTVDGTPVGSAPYTTKSGADIINWDYDIDGPNIKVILSGGVKNELTVTSATTFPNGASGFIIIDPTSTTTYKLPDEDYESAAGIKSYISNADPALGGSNPVRLQYTYDGTNFWFDKFTNMVAPIYPPEPEFDISNMIAFYHPESFNQAVSGPVTIGEPVPNISSSILIGDLAIGTDVTDFEYYIRDDEAGQPAHWDLGVASAQTGVDNVILTPLTLGASVSTNNSVSFYMNGNGGYDFLYNGLIDFYDGTGLWEEVLYLAGRKFETYLGVNPAHIFGYPTLIDYSSTGGADLSTEWLFVSHSINDTTDELTLYVGCQSSLDWARANPPVGPTTDWDYENGDGSGNTVPVDSEGLYKETVSVPGSITETTFNEFFYGNSHTITGESALCKLGMLGIYGAVIPDSQVISNWEVSRSTYYIT